MSTNDKVKKILSATDKVVKPISSFLAIILDEHKIRTIARLPKEILDAIKEVEKLGE